MIRYASLLWVVLAGELGFGLYHLKQEVAALEDQVVRVNRAVLAEQEAIHVLHAEWSYINQPARLQSLAQRHLDMRPTRPEQLGAIAALPPLPGAAVAAAPPAAQTAQTVRPVSLGGPR